MALTGGSRREGLWAVVPVKPYGEAKSRLREVLSEAQRSRLARLLQAHTLEVLAQALPRERILVVSSDEDALLGAAAGGVVALVEAGNGLNEALRQAAAEASRRGAGALLVLASDLPLLEPDDVEALLSAGEQADVVIAPDRGGSGTNALLLRPPAAIDFAFGDGSYRAHRSRAKALGLPWRSVVRDGLAFDLDLPADLADLRLQDAAGWLDLRAEAVEP